MLKHRRIPKTYGGENKGADRKFLHDAGFHKVYFQANTSG